MQGKPIEGALVDLEWWRVLREVPLPVRGRRAIRCSEVSHMPKVSQILQMVKSRQNVEPMRKRKQ